MCQQIELVEWRQLLWFYILARLVQHLSVFIGQFKLYNQIQCNLSTVALALLVTLYYFSLCCIQIKLGVNKIAFHLQDYNSLFQFISSGILEGKNGDLWCNRVKPSVWCHTFLILNTGEMHFMNPKKWGEKVFSHAVWCKIKIKFA